MKIKMKIKMKMKIKKKIKIKNKIKIIIIFESNKIKKNYQIATNSFKLKNLNMMN